MLRRRHAASAANVTIVHANSRKAKMPRKGECKKACRVETDRNSVSVSVTAPKLAIFLVSVTAVIVKHGFGLLSVTAEITTRFRREPKLSC